MYLNSFAFLVECVGNGWNHLFGAKSKCTEMIKKDSPRHLICGNMQAFDFQKLEYQSQFCSGRIYSWECSHLRTLEQMEAQREEWVGKTKPAAALQS